MKTEQTVAGSEKPVNLMVSEAILIPDVERAQKAMEAFEKLKKEILMPEKDYVNIKGKLAITRSGFAKISMAFGISTSIIKTSRIKIDDDYIVHTTSRAIAPNGRYAEASASCSFSELKKSSREATIHIVESMSQTRSSSRACANLCAGGTLALEEMEIEPQIQENERISQKQYDLLKKWLDIGNAISEIIENKIKELKKPLNEFTKQEAHELIDEILPKK